MSPLITRLLDGHRILYDDVTDHDELARLRRIGWVRVMNGPGPAWLHLTAKGRVQATEDVVR